MTKIDKEKAVSFLTDAIECRIKCTKCEDFAYNDNAYIATDWGYELFELGWKATENHIYCPVCAKTFKLK